MQSPRTNRLNNIEAANKLRHGSPKFQQVLRQRCRKQMQERRHKLFNSRRLGLEDDESVKDSLTEIVRREFSSMSSMLDDSSDSLAELMTWPDNQDELMSMEEEMLKEEEQWIMEEFHRMHQYEMDMMETYLEEMMKNEIICPICEKDIVTEHSGHFVCPTCQLCLPAKITMESFYSSIKSQVANHAVNCNFKASFMVFPENKELSLFLTCETCSYWGLVL
ncbi:RIP-like protein [Microplitis mediator]|uniref:RIP-like protein n=1 Tax=Microplitis mediator TaxID=375433 RepID=UPI00255550EE|nr:RIP-like protein [Microplitis mediator]